MRVVLFKGVSKIILTFPTSFITMSRGIGRQLECSVQASPTLLAQFNQPFALAARGGNQRWRWMQIKRKCKNLTVTEPKPKPSPPLALLGLLGPQGCCHCMLAVREYCLSRNQVKERLSWFYETMSLCGLAFRPQPPISHTSSLQRTCMYEL